MQFDQGLNIVQNINVYLLEFKAMRHTASGDQREFSKIV